MLCKKMLIKLEIDDTLNQFAIHGVCGLWGLIAAGIFDNEKGLIATGHFDLLMVQLIGTCAIVTWSLVPTFFFFLAFRKMSIFRVGEI